MKITSCRNCKSKYFSKLFTLGKMCFTGKFPKNLTTNIPKVVISLIMCKSCKLVQLDRNFNPKYLYDTNYGYRTGINATMTQHVKGVVKESIKIVKLKKKDSVLDIASNDGTLLNFYKKNIFRVGIDPLIKKYKNQYKNHDDSKNAIKNCESQIMLAKNGQKRQKMAKIRHFSLQF